MGLWTGQRDMCFAIRAVDESMELLVEVDDGMASIILLRSRA